MKLHRNAKLSVKGRELLVERIEHAGWSLTALAATDVVLVEIPARHFWMLVHETPYFAQLVMSVMANRLRRRGGTT